MPVVVDKIALVSTATVVVLLDVITQHRPVHSPKMAHPKTVSMTHQAERSSCSI
jgi:hypothetical protein